MLREVVEADLEAFFVHQSDLAAAQMAAFAPRGRAAFFAHWRQNVLVNPANRAMTIVVSGLAAGYVSSWQHEGRRYVAYWLGQEHWGMGIATRALQEFLSHEPTRPLFACVASHNVASVRVLRKCGFRMVEDVVASASADGVVELVMELAV